LLALQFVLALLKIFSYAFTSYAGLIIALQLTSIGFLKMHCRTYLLRFMSKLFLSFLNGREPWRTIRLKRNDSLRAPKISI